MVSDQQMSGMTVKSLSLLECWRFFKEAEKPDGVIGALRCSVDDLARPPDFLRLGIPRLTTWMALTQRGDNHLRDNQGKLEKWPLLSAAQPNFFGTPEIGLLFSEGEPWKAQRKAAASHVQPKNGVGYVIAQEAQKFADKIANDGGYKDFHDLCKETTLTISLKGLFQAVADPEQVGLIKQSLYVTEKHQRELSRNPVALCGQYVLRNMPGAGSLRPSLWFRNPELKQAEQAMANVFAHIFAEISPQEGTLLNKIALRDDIQALPQEQRLPQNLQEMHDLIVTSYETSATTTAWAFVELAQDQALQDELRAEFIAWQSRTEDWEEKMTTPAFLKDLPKLNGLIQEVLRVYPIPTTLPKQALDGFAINAEHSVEPGHITTVQTYMVHRAPEIPSAWAFDGRRNPEETEAFMRPFAEGNRNVCIGAHMAKTTIGNLVARTLLQSRLSLVGPFPGIQHNSLLRPDCELDLRAEPVVPEPQAA